jgi:predicted RNA-binding Zn-ribbon protein involved in translation (DUF1610 family)
MEKFVCPNCGKVSYSADTRSSQDCPYCTEKVVILNSQCLGLIRHLSYCRLIFDRRQGERRQQERIPVSNDRRVRDRRQNEGIVIGWVITKRKEGSSEVLS